MGKVYPVFGVSLMLGSVLLVVAAGTTVERWERWEESWKGPSTGNPFVDVDFTVELTLQEASDSVVVRGFYDGDGRYVVRFMPPTQGRWTFRTKSNSTALDGRIGNFTVVAPSSANNHGPVRVKPNCTTFSYADGSPHHTVGTTVYGLLGGWSNQNLTARSLVSLKESPFNKVRLFAFPTGNPKAPADLLPYEPLAGKVNASSDLTRFNLVYWRRMESVIQSLQDIGVEADVIFFNLYDQEYPAGLSCMGGRNATTYDTAADVLFLKYIVARLASFRNVWWSMSNEWNQCSCKWADAGVNPCPDKRDFSDPGCGADGSNSPALHTPIWDALFERVRAEDPSAHLLSIHNNGYLYNYSRPWITHFSIQHTHNKPQTLWKLHGRKVLIFSVLISLSLTPSLSPPPPPRPPLSLNPAPPSLSRPPPPSLP
jgi:hypothetical protein